MSILTNTDERADWLGRAHSLAMALQALETAISVAMTDRPTSSQAISLMIADQRLGIAVRALQQATDSIRGMR